MKKSTSKTGPKAKRSTIKEASTARAAAPAAAPAQGRKGMILVIFLLLCVGLAAQAYLLWRKDQKSKLVLSFVNVLSPIGRDQDGQFCCARDMAVDKDGNVLVLEAPEVGHRLQKLSPAGKFLAMYRPKGAQQVLDNGYGVAGGPDGKVYVVEAMSGKVKVLSGDLKYLSSFEIPCHSAGGMAINSKGEFYIADREKSDLLHLDSKGALIDRIEGGKKRIGGPYRLAISPDDKIFLLDFPRGFNAEPDVKVFGPKGEALAAWTIRGFQANPYNSIGWHPKGVVMINDNLGNSMAKGIYVFSENGKLMGNAMVSDNHLQLRNVSCMTVDTKSGDIYLNTNFIQRGGDRFKWDPDAVVAE